MFGSMGQQSVATQFPKGALKVLFDAMNRFEVHSKPPANATSKIQVDWMSKAMFGSSVRPEPLLGLENGEAHVALMTTVAKIIRVTTDSLCFALKSEVGGHSCSEATPYEKTI